MSRRLAQIDKMTLTMFLPFAISSAFRLASASPMLRQKTLWFRPRRRMSSAVVTGSDFCLRLPTPHAIRNAGPMQWRHRTVGSGRPLFRRRWYCYDRVGANQGDVDLFWGYSTLAESWLNIANSGRR